MSVKILIGDVRDRLKELPDESVHCVVTSPPYWGLRDYGTGQWEGGDLSCQHDTARNEVDRKAPNTIVMRPGVDAHNCRCGARRIDRQLGLEPTLAEHVETMADVFDEVRRVLRKDGTLWLNYGDSYAASVNGRSAADTKALGEDDRTFRDKPFSTVGPIGGLRKWDRKSERNRHNLSQHDDAVSDYRPEPGGILKPKDLCGIPWRVAFALQERGWYLRQDIIWHKPNPMPESIRDRCTKAHEYIFLLSKSRRYYFDAEAISEDSLRVGEIAGGGPKFKKDAANDGRIHNGGTMRGEVPPTRNRRSVWTIATAPFSESHFATFPPELPELCIKAGTSQKGCCATCGAPWVRSVAKEFIPQDDVSEALGVRGHAAQKPMDDSNSWQGFPRGTTKSETLGWSPSCSCNAAVVPATVLDPFGGAGTTGMVADRLQRNAVLIELNPTYAAMAEKRISGDRGGLLDLMEAAE